MISTQWIMGISGEELAEVHAIRYAVFCKEQQVDPSIERDDLDSSAIHLLVYFNDIPAATGRLLLMNDKCIIGRVAVLPRFRRIYLGDLVVRMLIRMAYSIGENQQWVHSQVAVQGFYEKLGFKPQGDVYEEAGIAHIKMMHEGDIYGECKHYG